MKNVLSRYTLFIILLPVFFVLHSYTDNFDLIPILPAIRLLGIYLLVSQGFVLMSYLLYRDKLKSALTGFSLMAFYFFFGTLQDTVNDIVPRTFLTRYSFLLPFSLVCFIILIILLKRSKNTLVRTTLYLNSLMLILVFIDCAGLASKLISRAGNEVIPSESLSPCSNCPTPDIYLVLADGYPGFYQSRNILNHDNRPFEEQLKERGFHISDSSLANYNYTFFSMASMLNMNYLKNVQGSILDRNNIPSASRAMRYNQVSKFFRDQGYHFFNYSIFNLANKKTITQPTFWVRDTRPITHQTLLYRLNRDIGYHLVTTLKIKPVNPFPIEQDLENNELVYKKTLEVTRVVTSPKFVYTHLVMPHHPYYYDSLGNKTPLASLTQLHGFNKAAAASYMVYTNKKLLALVDTIKANSKISPIIILASDHGFREISGDKDKKTMFLNLNAVFFPNQDYRHFYKGMSNVNLFRVVMNSQFRQQLNLLTDSTIYLKD